MQITVVKDDRAKSESFVKKTSFSASVPRDGHFIYKNFAKSRRTAPPLGTYKPKLLNK